MSEIDELMYVRPHLGARVDYGNPLTNGLWMCYLFNEGGGTEVHDSSNNGAGVLSFAGSPTPTWGQFGVKLNGGYLRNNKTVKSAFNPIAGSHTLRFVHIPTNLPGFYNTAIEVYNTTRHLSLFLSTTGNVTYVSIGGTDYALPIAQMDMAPGKVSDLVWVFERGDRTSGGSNIFKHYFYTDGILRLTATGTSAGTTWPTTAGYDMNVGYGPSGGVGNYYGEILQIQGWNRGLQQSEIWELASNPHALVSNGPYHIIGKVAVTDATATATFGTVTLTAPVATAYQETSSTATATFGTVTLTAPTATAGESRSAEATFGTITLTAPVALGYASDNTATATFTSVVYLQAPTCSPFGPPFTVYMQDKNYWGRFSRGQYLNVMWNPEEEPEGTATVDFWLEGTSIVKSIGLPALDDVYNTFGYSLLLDNDFEDGNYVAVIRFVSGVTAQCSLGYLSVMGGTGSPPIIGIMEIDRTLGRSVITQDADGRFMIGYQPQLAAYAVE